MHENKEQSYSNQQFSYQQRSKVIHCKPSPSTSQPSNNPSKKPSNSKSIMRLLDNFSLYSGSTKKTNNTTSKKNNTLQLPKKPESVLPFSYEEPKQKLNLQQNKGGLLSPIYSTTAMIPYKPEIQSYPPTTGQGLPININDLLLIEEKVINLISSLNNKQLYVNNNCIEWWNCYYVSFMCNGTLTKFFQDNENKLIFNDASNLLMYSIIITYYNYLILKDNEKENEICLDLVLYHHRLYLLMCEYVLIILDISQATLDEYVTITKINKQISSYIKHSSDNKGNAIISDINKYCSFLGEIINKYIVGLKSNQNITKTSQVHTSEICDLFYNLKHLTSNELNDFFISSFLQRPALNISTKPTGLSSSKGKNSNYNITTTKNILNNIITEPYLKHKSTKKYTLVLDLDETLIHFKYDKINEPEITHGVVQYRPCLFEFLNNISEYCELIIFTVGTKDYADSVIDFIEKNRQYFSGRLYREHTSIYNNDFVKDLSKIGRDLTKVIIVDDKPYNFILQMENGIAIRPFWGDESDKEKNDVALLNLFKILVDIFKLNLDDIREGIKKYRNEIVNKVSSDIYKNNIFND
jgi:Dullard-like phosphatase family protein